MKIKSISPIPLVFWGEGLGWGFSLTALAVESGKQFPQSSAFSSLTQRWHKAAIVFARRRRWGEGARRARGGNSRQPSPLDRQPLPQSEQPMPESEEPMPESEETMPESEEPMVQSDKSIL